MTRGSIFNTVPKVDLKKSISISPLLGSNIFCKYYAASSFKEKRREKKIDATRRVRTVNRILPFFSNRSFFSENSLLAFYVKIILILVCLIALATYICFTRQQIIGNFIYNVLFYHIIDISNIIGREIRYCRF